ncbi:MAG TPA: hypothetical protein VF173_36535 [Thermoanaerobaculia bacterium]|nr:hypothetical protein [Thermoanaerobaculia bacterium]
MPEQDLPDFRTALLDVVAGCATLAERLGDPGFAPLETQKPEVLAGRERRWREAAADGDPARFDALLASLDLDPGAARAALRDVRVRDPRRLPPWAEEFLRLLESADFAARLRRRAPPRVSPRTGPPSAALSCRSRTWRSASSSGCRRITRFPSPPRPAGRWSTTWSPGG